jgi:hypothetical protein
MSKKNEMTADKVLYTVGVLDGVWWALNCRCSGFDEIGALTLDSEFRKMSAILSKKINIKIDKDLIETVMKESVLIRS